LIADIVSPILQWLNSHPQLSGLVTFIISAAESVAIIGTIVPGSVMMTAIGTLAGAGIIPLWATIVWAILGAIVGDGISYWVGHYFKDRLRRVWPFRDYPNILDTGEKFVQKYGIMSVFIGRFVGPVRALVPLVAGMLGMSPLSFTIANVTSAIGWAPIYMLPGILLGAASLELPPDIALHVMMVLVLLVLFFILCIWMIIQIFYLIRKQINQLLDWIWLTLKQSRYFSIVTTLLKHHNPIKQHGQLSLAFYLIVSSVLFIALVCYVKLKTPEHLFVNNAMFHFFRGMRSPHLDHLMISITMLGQERVILPIIIVLFVWLMIIKRQRAAYHLLAVGMLGASSIFILKHVIQSPRPWGIMLSPHSYSMPSGHSTLSTMIFMSIAFFIAHSSRAKFHRLIYTSATILVLMIGISRLYLGAHWFTDVISGWLLAAILLILIILSYLREPEKKIQPLHTLSIGLVTLLITYLFFYHQQWVQFKTDYTVVHLPRGRILFADWWSNDQSLLSYRTNLFGFPSQPINIEWAESLDRIKKALSQCGWTSPPERNWVSILHRISDVKSTNNAMLISPRYLDKKPALILTRYLASKKITLVARLWDSNFDMKESNTTIWVGVIGKMARTYSWIYKKHPSYIAINMDLMCLNKEQKDQWQWKWIQKSEVKNRKKPTLQKILLIRPKN
jgi:membrane protein DedA with SNARE-associated domain/membrane-associated phospholipid phosphatase